VEFDGRPAYGLARGPITEIRNPATFNLMAHLRNGQVIDTDLPELGSYSWPLWVGKAWTTTYTFHDVARNFTAGPGPVERHVKVAAYEDVSVPAGTFKAFRIETTPGRNDAVSETIWYAPDVKLAVKYIYRQEPNHYLGPGQAVVELLTVPK
jgi:hypothetical protein